MVDVVSSGSGCHVVSLGSADEVGARCRVVRGAWIFAIGACEHNSGSVGTEWRCSMGWGAGGGDLPGGGAVACWSWVDRWSRGGAGIAFSPTSIHRPKPPYFCAVEWRASPFRLLVSVYWLGGDRELDSPNVVELVGWREGGLLAFGELRGEGWVGSFRVRMLGRELDTFGVGHCGDSGGKLVVVGALELEDLVWSLDRLREGFGGGGELGVGSFWGSRTGGSLMEWKSGVRSRRETEPPELAWGEWSLIVSFGGRSACGWIGDGGGVVVVPLLQLVEIVFVRGSPGVS
ncbi:hypothetical protein Tco_1136388 [Tanacetum coccineum]